MALHPGKLFTLKAFLRFVLALLVLMLILVVYISIVHTENNLDHFAETTVALSDGWVLTDSAGVSRTVSLPLTIPYGTDGLYTLSIALPNDERLMPSPIIDLYSNYVDIDVSLDGVSIYAYPHVRPVFSGATANTDHFIRLPLDYAGKTLRIAMRCQLGDDITYLLKPALLGSKATILRNEVMRSLPVLLVSGCMVALGVGLAVLQLVFRRRLGVNEASLYTALFAFNFAVYACCESSLTHLLIRNEYVVSFATYMLLAMLPLPLVGLFAGDLGARFRRVPPLLMALCTCNIITQTILNFSSTLAFRVMLPATHFTIITTIVLMALCLLFTPRAEKPEARRRLVTALPMIAGGTIDIVLLWFERPSFNNSFWFTVGVSAFVIFQFVDFLRSYSALYRMRLENEILRDAAYRDTMTNIGNRNAYERKLKELNAQGSHGRLCCIVLDINDLKLINDTLGHQAGDTAIIETGRLLGELMPRCASCFRSGGDEFIIFLDGLDEKQTADLAARLADEAVRRSDSISIPLSLAVGFGRYELADGNINDFVRRIDALMYERKRAHKAETGG